MRNWFAVNNAMATKKMKTRILPTSNSSDHLPQPLGFLVIPAVLAWFPRLRTSVAMRIDDPFPKPRPLGMTQGEWHLFKQNFLETNLFPVQRSRPVT